MESFTRMRARIKNNRAINQYFVVAKTQKWSRWWWMRVWVRVDLTWAMRNAMAHCIQITIICAISNASIWWRFVLGIISILNLPSLKAVSTMLLPFLQVQFRNNLNSNPNVFFFSFDSRCRWHYCRTISAYIFIQRYPQIQPNTFALWMTDTVPKRFWICWSKVSELLKSHFFFSQKNLLQVSTNFKRVSVSISFFYCRDFWNPGNLFA